VFSYFWVVFAIFPVDVETDLFDDWQQEDRTEENEE
jgi:hypothetical protein